MALTNAQVATLATDIENNTNQTVIDALAAGNNNAIRDWYNEQASPNFWVLKNSISVDELVESLDWTGEYADFKDDMPAIRLLLDNGTYAPQPVGAREALNAVFTGAGNSKAAILGMATRTATNAEKLFAVSTTGPGGGNGSAQAQSAIPEVEGNITRDDVLAAVSLIGD